MPSPRICVVAPEFIGPFPNGGVGTACYWEAATLAHAGYDVTVLYTGPTQRETPEHWQRHFAASAPFRYEDLGSSTSAAVAARLTRYEHACAEERTAELVLAWLQERRFDLVLFQEFLGHGGRALQGRRSGVALAGTRAATTMHSCRQWIYEGMNRLPGGPWDLAVDFLEKESARLADRVIAPSRHMAAWAASRWHLATPATVIPYCYDPTLAQPPAIVSHAGPFRHLVFFGRLETRKGLHLFCRALVNSPELQQHVEQVTFLGKPSSVEGQPSEEFIAAHMARIPGVQWKIIGDAGSFEAQAWLAAQKNILVVAPSLVDNLPYAVIELHTRRIPFVTTGIGGIPEIVGEANRPLLAQPTESSLATVIGRVCRDGHVVIDYGSGYDVARANADHVDFVREMLAAPPPRPAASVRQPFQVVVTNAADEATLARVRERISRADPETSGAPWIRVEDWMGHAAPVPALFIDARVRPEAGCATLLLAALDQPGVDMATCYFTREDDADTTRVVAPYGASLETGWRQNTFGGPCFAAGRQAFAALRAAALNGSFAFWPAYAAVVCRGMSLIVVPAPLYTVTADALQLSGHAELEAVVHEFHSQMPADMDLGWMLKSVLNGAPAAACHGAPGQKSIGRALYDRLTSIPDDLLATYAGLSPDAETDPYVRNFAGVRNRLAEVMERWRTSEPRVFVYGTGEHTRMLLTVCPDFGRFVAGFIDRQAMGRFLGKPCVTPDQFRSEMADAIVYSSREFEHEMHASLTHARVEHVLLYRESPPVPEATTATRLRNRFGHAPTNLSTLNAMYPPPSWAKGHVSGSDAAFLCEMIAAQQASTVVELGVASGVSSAVLLYALDQLPAAERRALYSADVRATCYFDEAYATGQACREMYPSPRARWHTAFDMGALELAGLLPAASVDLTFIDANHSHPFPLLDLLQVTAFAKPGSWVVLHDVELPIQHPQYQVYGPRWLFQMWPFNKVKSFDKWASIGAVQLPEDVSLLVPLALSLLAKPWEQAPTIDIVLPAAFSAVQAVLETRLRREQGVLATQ